MKYCISCGNALKDTALFCPVCGTKVAKHQEPVPSEPVPMERPVYTPPVQEAPAAEPVYTPPVEEPVYQPTYTAPVQKAPASQPVYTAPVRPAQPVQPVYSTQPVRPAQPVQQPVYSAPVQQHQPAPAPKPRRKLNIPDADFRLSTVVLGLLAVTFMGWIQSILTTIVSRFGTDYSLATSLSINAFSNLNRFLLLTVALVCFVTAILPKKPAKLILKISRFVLIGFEGFFGLLFLSAPKLFYTRFVSSYYGYGFSTSLLRTIGFGMIFFGGAAFVALLIIKKRPKWWLYAAASVAVLLLSLIGIGFTAILASARAGIVIVNIFAGLNLSFLQAVALILPSLGLLDRPSDE